MPIRLAAAAALVCGLVFAAAAAAAPFELITAAELRGEQEALARAAEAPRTRSMPAPAPKGAPAIRVLAPHGGAAVPSPLRIELAFDAAPGARIVPASFRVLYGVLKIDLTERLRRNARISEAGVVVEQALIPDGSHRLFMQVSDDKGNLAEQELRLRVGPAS
jgi:hypothetical protein